MMAVCNFKNSRLVYICPKVYRATFMATSAQKKKGRVMDKVG